MRSAVRPEETPHRALRTKGPWAAGIVRRPGAGPVRARVWLGLAVGVAAAASAGLPWAIGSALSAPAPRSVGPPPATLEATECAFPSASGSTLRGWVSRGVAGGGAVVLAHSVRSSRLEMVGRAEFLRAAGYSTILFDAQAHGESPGARITFGYLEARDARAAVELARVEFPGEAIGYLGVSQGGAAALLGPAPLPVEALVVEAVHPTLRHAVVNRISLRLGPLASLLAPVLLAQIEPRLGVPVADLAPIEGVRHVRAPLLLIAGEQDRRTRIEESRALFEAAPRPKSLWVVPGAAHQDFHRFMPAEYERRVLDFLSGALRAARSP